MSVTVYRAFRISVVDTILKSANEFVKYFIPFCKISVGLLVSPLFIFILHSAIAF